MNTLMLLLNKYPKLPIVVWGIFMVYFWLMIFNSWNKLNDQELIKNEMISTGAKVVNNSNFEDVSGSFDKIKKILEEVARNNRYTIMWFLEGVDCSKLSNSFSSVGILSYDCPITDNEKFIKSIAYINNFLSTSTEFGPAFYFDSTSKVNIDISNWKASFKILKDQWDSIDKYFLATREQEYIFTLKAKNNFWKIYSKGTFEGWSSFKWIISGFSEKFNDFKLKTESKYSYIYTSNESKWYIDEMNLNIPTSNNNSEFTQVGVFDLNWAQYRTFIFYDRSKLNVKLQNSLESSYLKFKTTDSIIWWFLINDEAGEVIFLSKEIFK